MPDFNHINDLLWSFSALVTSLVMCWTLWRDREVNLDPRVRFMLLGMLIVWIGNAFVPLELHFNFTDMWLSTILLMLGGAINIQILLEWKFGKYAWLKVAAFIVALTTMTTVLLLHN